MREGEKNLHSLDLQTVLYISPLGVRELQIASEFCSSKKKKKNPEITPQQQESIYFRCWGGKVTFICVFCCPQTQCCSAFPYFLKSRPVTLTHTQTELASVHFSIEVLALSLKLTTETSLSTQKKGKEKRGNHIKTQPDSNSHNPYKHHSSM